MPIPEVISRRVRKRRAPDSTNDAPHVDCDNPSSKTDLRHGIKRLKESLATIDAWEWVAIVSLVAVVLVTGLMFIARHAPLGWDESVYALRTRHYIEGDVFSTYWNDYRAVGMPLLMTLAWPFGNGSAELRAVALGASLALLVITWLWVRHLAGPRAGVIAAALLAVTPGYVMWSWLIGVDLPGTALGLGAILVFTLASRGDRVRWWALWSAPLAGAAALVRFGSPPVVAAGMAAVALARWSTVRRSFLATTATTMATGGAVLAVLMVPAVSGADQSPYLAFRRRQTAKDLSVFESVADFADLAPRTLGPVVITLVAIGLAASVGFVLVRRTRASTALPLAVGLGSFGLWFVTLNAALAQGFLQYLLPGLPFLFAAVAPGLARLSKWVPARIGAGILVIIVAAGLVPAYQMAADASQRHVNSFARIRTASQELATETDGTCAVVTSFAPQVAWYSGCDAVIFSASALEDPNALFASMKGGVSQRLGTLDHDTPLFVLLARQGKRQPRGGTLEALVARSEGLAFEVGRPEDGKLQHVEVFAFGTVGEFIGETSGSSVR